MVLIPGFKNNKKNIKTKASDFKIQLLILFLI